MLRKLAALVSLVVLISVLSFSFAYAGSSPQGTWYIHYYSASSSCSGSPYSPTMKDGGGFAANQPSNNNQDPIVVGGNSIDVNITVTGALPDTQYYYEVEGQTSPVLLLTTDGSGNGSACITVTIPSTSSTTSPNNCFTVPQKIGVGGSSPKDFNGNIIDHFWTGGGCTPTTSVPEFPLGIPILLTLLIPAILLMKKRFSIA
ncbi:MAG: hypothetical protein QXV32_03845 [Conexivisphaerales archaeon]